MSFKSVHQQFSIFVYIYRFKQKIVLFVSIATTKSKFFYLNQYIYAKIKNCRWTALKLMNFALSWYITPYCTHSHNVALLASGHSGNL